MVLVSLLGICGLVLAILVFEAVTRGNPPAASPGRGPPTPVPFFATAWPMGAGAATVKLYGVVWNLPAGLDASFTIPDDLSAAYPIAAGQLAGAGLERLEITRIPATFTDRSGTSTPSTHPGTITLLVEGASEIDDLGTVDAAFSPADSGWDLRCGIAAAGQGRLSQVSVTLDCPDLGMFEQAVSDWEEDFAELFEESPLDITLIRSMGTVAGLFADDAG